MKIQFWGLVGVVGLFFSFQGSLQSFASAPKNILPEQKPGITQEVQQENLYTQTGVSRKFLPGGVTEVGLGNGLTRIDWPDGRSEVHGVVYQGKPVVYHLDGRNELWHFNLNELATRLERNAVWHDPSLTGCFNFTPSPEGSVRYTQYYPGIDGNQQSTLTLYNGMVVQVFSEHPLTMIQLGNIAWVAGRSPSTTFASQNGERALYVADSLGEVRVIGGKFAPLGGVHDTASGSIFIRTGELDNFQAAAFVLRHESGHAVDARLGWLSKGLKDKDGLPLFGRGEVVLDGRGVVDLAKSSFKSEYASTNANEDFAETHELLLRFREEYNQKSRGKDLFGLAAAEFLQESQTWGYSSRLSEKMSAIIHQAYSMDSALSFPDKAPEGAFCSFAYIPTLTGGVLRSLHNKTSVTKTAAAPSIKN